MADNIRTFLRRRGWEVHAPLRVNGAAWQTHVWRNDAYVAALVPDLVSLIFDIASPPATVPRAWPLAAVLCFS